MAALAHDLKTPITLIGGNAELLLEEDLQEDQRKMVKTILNSRAKQYVLSLLEASRGEDETFEQICLEDVFAELCRNAELLAQAKNIRLQEVNSLKGSVRVQKHHLLRGIGNVIQNAMEFTPEGGTVVLEGSLTEGGWGYGSG